MDKLLFGIFMGITLTALAAIVVALAKEIRTVHAKEHRKEKVISTVAEHDED